MRAVHRTTWIMGLMALGVTTQAALATDCNTNGISDTNGLEECGPLEVVILLDTSTSMPDVLDAICNGTNGLRSELDDLVTDGMDLTYEILDLGALAAFWTNPVW